MTNHATLPSQNESFGFFGTVTNCPHRDRPSAEVWALAFSLIAEATHAESEDEMIGIRDFLDSRWGRHFADDVIGNITGCNTNLEAAITAAIAKWQDWRISRRTQREEGIPAGLPYLTGWVQHFAVTAAMEDAD
ncbi:hypothetical protein [Salibaculum griseiflavum]|uniref:Uncharacterized protein n=1 Tax=Salibaculum griseiflavum TaxID=1914409 RepID=A0A2V1P432_9RHOB|nr:hypothetical protein [Salibaculum griseiflavum]PWG16177.1 hypothetical protein DFK10_13035 [Salibaculum griseiflavum]